MDDEQREFEEWREFQAQRAQRQQQVAPPPVQPVELTGKEWKAMILIGALLMLFGTLFTCSGTFSSSNWTGYIPIGMLALGLYLTIMGKVGAWWYHR